jgi:hypothetical protein
MHCVYFSFLTYTASSRASSRGCSTKIRIGEWGRKERAWEKGDNRDSDSRGKGKWPGGQQHITTGNRSINRRDPVRQISNILSLTILVCLPVFQIGRSLKWKIKLCKIERMQTKHWIWPSCGMLRLSKRIWFIPKL